MARPRKPTALLEASGAFRHNPQRRRASEPKPEGPLDPPPDWFNAAQLEEWNCVIKQCPKGVLTSADWLAVRTIAVLGGKVRRGTAKIGEINLHNKILGQFGMTASSRNSVSVPSGDEPNPFDAI
jgi:hypothetical protein